MRVKKTETPASGKQPSVSYDANEPAKKPKRKRRVLDTILNILPILGILVSVIMFSYPYLSDMYWQIEAEQSISTLTSKTSQLDSETGRMYQLQAITYNSQLGNYDISGEVEELGLGALLDGEVWEYKNQLLYKDEPMMSFIEIPKLKIKLPIYHGTDDETLAAGVGHLEGTSLPVGGTNSHCVLSGHSGMTNTRMFDDIRLLENGDTLVLWSLGEPYAYSVYDSEIVVPSDVSSLGIHEGEDEVTLITCTQLDRSIQRLNTHRLLVHARRCEYVPEEIEEEAVTSSYVDMRFIYLCIGLLVLLILILVSAIRILRNARKKRKAEKQE